MPHNVQTSYFQQNFPILTKFHNFERISQFWQDFTILTEFHNFDRTSKFWQNFTILTEFHNFDQISQSWQNFTTFGKNLIYHLLNKNFRKYVKLLLNKKRVNETVNLLLPSQTPSSIPYSFRWHIIVSVPEIKISLMDETIFSKKQ